ncbi:MAG: AAA family ATPase [Bacteroidales bacterium]|nr:AAA family ATPase [Bacteroidales bacterium]
MYIKSIKLQNYRNYENVSIELGKKATVLIGKNGMGKTNLISALKQSLSFAFSKNSNISQKNFIANTIASIKSFDPTDAIRKMREDGTQSKDGSYPVKITTTMDIDTQSPLEVVLEKKDVNSGIKELYVNASIAFWKKYDDLKDLPVYGFYSDSYPHERVTIGTKIQKLLNSEFGISQTAGYYNWDDPRDCTLVWLQFFTQQWKNYMYGHRDNEEEEYLKSVRECLKEFSEPLENAAENTDFELKDITVVARGKNEVVVLQFKNGLELDFDSLPAGYRRAYSIAFDLANRAFLLNKNCNPDGVAFIDEVDLHLHPSLAQEIVERLQHTFPRIQFIVSTHSPLVLSNFKQDEDNVVYQLNRNEDFTTGIQKIDYSYGIDYNSLLVDLMGTKVRNTMLRQLIESYNYWKDAEEEELMNSTLEEIKGMVGEDSRIVNELVG